MPTPTQYLLPIIHPAFELLKRSARMLHFTGASIILVNGLFFLQEHGANKLLCYLQMIIAAEVYLVLFLGKAFLINSPGLNVFFRFIESMTLVGIGLILLSFGHSLSGWLHLVVAAGYFFLFYREWRIMCSESVDIRQTGITVPNFIKNEEISWPEIKSIHPKYHSINIETIRNKTIRFKLRRNLKIEELQQIDEFCQQHLAG